MAKCERNRQIRKSAMVLAESGYAHTIHTDLEHSNRHEWPHYSVSKNVKSIARRLRRVGWVYGSKA